MADFHLLFLSEPEPTWLSTRETKKAFAKSRSSDKNSDWKSALKRGHGQVTCNPVNKNHQSVLHGGKHWGKRYLFK